MLPQSKRCFVAAIEKAHSRRLRRFLSLRMRGSPNDVQDLVQEIYLRMLRLKAHEAVRNPQAYLYTIARHVLHQHALRRGNAPVNMDPLDVVSALDRRDLTADPAEQVDIEQRIEAVGHALQMHSPRAYATLVMYRCEGLTLKQIGERLNVSSVMARKYLVSATSYFSRHLDADGKTAP